MSRLRVKVSGKLTVLSPLHVGSGEGRVVAAVRGAPGSNVSPEVAAIQRDASGAPWIPGSTIKGLLRRLPLPKDQADWFSRLLGRLGDDDDQDNPSMMGSLLIRGATFAGAADARELPYADKNPAAGVAHLADGRLGPGIYVAARTAIDPSLGIASDARLFFQEVVAPKASFTLNLLLDLRAPASVHPAAKDALLALLARLADSEGVSIGSGQADGQGRIRLEWDSLRIAEGVITKDGSLPLAPRPNPKRSSTLPPPPRRRRWEVTLQCDGPFVVLDGSYAPPTQDGHGDPQLKAQQSAGLPVIPGPSLMGVLRARAGWIAALMAHRAGGDGKTDDRDKIFRDERRTPLSPVERLFGVAGYRGLLELASLRVTSAQPFRIHSVRLDRFSGAPIDNALFETACFTNVQAKVLIDLADRAVPVAGLQAAETLASDLMKDLASDGLRIGHGTNRGFGWFSATVKEA